MRLALVTLILSLAALPAQAMDLEAEIQKLYEACVASPADCEALLTKWLEEHADELPSPSTTTAPSDSSALPSSAEHSMSMASASTPSASAILWLQSDQNLSGSWGTPWFEAFQPTTELRDTTVVLDALPPSLAEVQTGFSWLDTQTFRSFDYLARATAVRAAAGQNVSGDLGTLSAARQPAIADPSFPGFPGGGWGTADGFESNALDTALVLQAFAADGQTSDMAQPVAFLLACQNLDGGFGLRPAQDSNLFVSLRVILALADFQAVSGVPAAIQTGVDYLLAHQDASGAIGETPGNETVQATALGKIALDLAGRNTEAALAESALLALQQPNGSWNDKPYDTAVALKALPEPAATIQILFGLGFLNILGRVRRRS